MSEASTLNPAQHSSHLRQSVTIHVNERPVELPEHDATGWQIKQAAIAQSVPIQLNFILVEELGHDRTKPIIDSEPVHVTDHSRFLANDGDDNS
jgi:hypothetical protein